MFKIFDTQKYLGLKNSDFFENLKKIWVISNLVFLFDTSDSEYLEDRTFSVLYIIKLTNDSKHSEL